MFNLEAFINQYVTKRQGSMFEADITANRGKLSEEIGDASILVIGGAGSIGSSFIRAVLPFGPAELVVVDTNENALTELTRSLRASMEYCNCIPEDYLTYPMDYRSTVFKRMFRSHKRTGRSSRKTGGFDIVANFSAHKHVRSEKDIYSIEAMLQNNVAGAKELLDLLCDYPPDTFFCVSTDKAANPVNIMGASKRIMEDLIFSYSEDFPVKTARFANVAFSNGSLPDGFLRRMEQLQPLSAPSDVKRYFVSPRESGQICMLSAITGVNRAIFFPRLDESQMTTFDAIAVDLLREYGYEPVEYESDEEAVEAAVRLADGSREYPVHFSKSDTSGEKAYEEFYTEGEQVDLSSYRSLGVITGKPVPDRRRIEGLLAELTGAFDRDGVTKEDIVGLISGYLPEFSHIETGRSLDKKM